MILAGLLIGGSLPAAAGEPNTLTPQELSDGWILLFDGNTLFGWKSVGNAQWVVRDSAIESRSGAGFLETTTEFADTSPTFTPAMIEDPNGILCGRWPWQVYPAAGSSSPPCWWRPRCCSCAVKPAPPMRKRCRHRARHPHRHRPLRR
ncbi:MAG TPA: hypothetical protein P5022_11050, partial [Candidatus Paceibacterota bacterium]|nr:hypothetical protein [Candidatus Paceibacterota bacterium]